MLLLILLVIQALMLLLSGNWGILAFAISVGVTLLVFAGTFRYGEGRYIEPGDDMDWLVRGMEREAERAGIRAPKLYLLDDYIPNAYSVGNVVVLSLGLFEILSREEILAVVAHEIGHIKNHDGMMFPLIAYGRVFMLLSTVELVLVHATPYFIPASMALLVLYEWSRARFIRLREFRADGLAVTLLDDPMSLKDALEELEYYNDLILKVRRHALPGIEPSIKRREGRIKMEKQYWIPFVFSFPTHPSYSERILNIMAVSQVRNAQVGGRYEG
ncbi:MAG: M48 family metalloprotease [Thermococci archaeon]|nr:M48 family metalloprotease [Thermococci archaeon]